MAFDYASLRTQTVERLINEFGDDGQFAVNVNGSGDPWDSDLDDETLHAVRCVRTKFQKSDNNGTLVEENDSLFLVSTKGVTIDPKLADRFITNGVTRQIVRIDPLKPGPVVMLWKAHCRK